MAFNVYFADRHFNIKGMASTEMPGALRIIADKEQADIESGSISQEMSIAYTDPVAIKEIVKVGNYMLYQDANGESHFLTIITTDNFASVSQIDLYAEDAGLDLLNETSRPYAADKAYPIAYYIDKFTYDTGFTVGINELGTSLNRKLEWTGESTFTERLLSVATQFDNAELRFSFVVEGLKVTAKHVDIYKKRSRSLGATLVLGRDVTEIKTSESIENLTTAYIVTGGTPEGSDTPVTLEGYSYNDGRFQVSGDKLLDNVSNEIWTRYLAPFETGTSYGYLVKTFSYDTTDQKELCNRAVSALKKASQIEQNFEVDIAVLPKDVQVGDMVNIVDYRGELYLEARVLSLETSRTDQTSTAVLGEYLIKDSGIAEQLKAMASQIAEAHKVVEQAKSFATVTELQAVQEIANSAKDTADKASGDVQEVKDTADQALLDAAAALEAGEDAKQQLVPVLSDLQELQALSVTQGQAIEDTKTAIQEKADELNADWQEQVDQYNAEIAEIKQETDKIADIAAQGNATAQTVDEQNQTITDIVAKTEDAVAKVATVETSLEGITQTVGEVKETAEGTEAKLVTVTQTADEAKTTAASALSKAELAVTPEQVTISIKEAKDYTDESLGQYGIHPAWKMPDGTFTKVLPGENLWQDTQAMKDSSLWNNYSSWTILDEKYQGLTIVQNKNDWNGLSQVTKVKTGESYTISAYARLLEIDATGDIGIYPERFDPALEKATVSPTFHMVPITSAWTRISRTFTFQTDGYANIRIERTSKHTNTLQLAGLKLERGSTATPYTPSPQDDPINAVPKWIGFCIKDSDNPADYEWELNTDYIDAVYQQALLGKVDTESFLDSIADKVSDSELTAVTDTLNALQNNYDDFVTNTFVSKLNDLESRSAGLVAELGNKVATFNFMQDYIKLGAEGLLIGAKDSPLQMLLTKDTLAFIASGNTKKPLAYFSNQSFYINRGAIVESLTVGSHKFAKLDDDYTVLQWIGGAA